MDKYKEEKIKLELDDIFEDNNSYTGSMLKEDKLFEDVLAYVLEALTEAYLKGCEEGYKEGTKITKEYYESLEEEAK